MFLLDRVNLTNTQNWTGAPNPAAHKDVSSGLTDYLFKVEKRTRCKNLFPRKANLGNGKSIVTVKFGCIEFVMWFLMLNNYTKTSTCVSIFGCEFSLGEMSSWAFLLSLALSEAQGCFRPAVEQNRSGVTMVAILARAKCTFWTLFCRPICVLCCGLCMVSILLSGLLLSVFLESVEVQTSWKESLVSFFFLLNPCFQFFLNLTHKHCL